jgi:hypothetical protein
MIKSEQGRRNGAPDPLDHGNGNGNGHSKGTLESIPEVVAPPVLARGARTAMMGRGRRTGEDGDENGGGDGDENEGGADGEGEEGDGGVGIGKKRKRNKPTLSCGECVERKTKVCDSFLFGMVEVLIFIICGYFLQVVSISNVMSVGLRATLKLKHREHSCHIFAAGLGIR